MRGQNKKHRTIRKAISGPNFTGQHLLHHPVTIRKLIETAKLESTDTVLDIGAGKGGLTFPIAEKAGRVIAIEVDADFAEALRAKAESRPHIRIVRSDIRTMRLPDAPFCVVANIPFAITTAILEKLLGTEGKGFRRGALILEKGAAIRFTDRFTADPRLLTWRMNFEFRIEAGVPRSHFSPPPGVDAAIVRITRREPPLVPVKQGRRFAAFAAFVLREPRLCAAASLREIFTPAQMKASLKLARIDREQAVASLSLEQWASLFGSMLRYAAPYRWPK